MQTGDTKLQLSENINQHKKQAIEFFEKTYAHLAQDGGLSEQDYASLLRTFDALSAFVESQELSR
jgi:hypothetical protein